MTSKLSTYVEELNFREILDNVLVRAFWKKKWNLLIYGDITITAELASIDILGDLVHIMILAKHVGEMSTESFWDTTAIEVISLELSEDHFNEVIFKKRLHKAVSKALKSLETRLIKRTPRYLELECLKKELRGRHIEDAITYLDTQGVTDEGIRESYINTSRNNFSFPEIYNYIDSMSGKILEKEMRMAEVVFGE